MANTTSFLEHMARRTLTITMPDESIVLVSDLPEELRQGVAVLDEWLFQLRTLKLEVSKHERAIGSMKADLISAITSHREAKAAARTAQRSSTPQSSGDVDPTPDLPYTGETVTNEM